MFRELLSRSFILEQLESVEQQLGTDIANDLRQLAKNDLEKTDYVAAHEAIRITLDNERSQSSGQKGYVINPKLPEPPRYSA
jgi:hypothetical protein